jgi:hypothetical protein
MSPSLSEPTNPVDAWSNGPSRAAKTGLGVIPVRGVRGGDHVGRDKHRWPPACATWASSAPPFPDPPPPFPLTVGSKRTNSCNADFRA